MSTKPKSVNSAVLSTRAIYNINVSVVEGLSIGSIRNHSLSTSQFRVRE